MEGWRRGAVDKERGRGDEGTRGRGEKWTSG